MMKLLDRIVIFLFLIRLANGLSIDDNDDITDDDDDDITDNEYRRNIFARCTSIVPDFTKMSCESKLRLITNYNKFRDKVASGNFEKHPTVGNMHRWKWLPLAQKFAQDITNNCDDKNSTHVVLNAATETYECDFIFKSRVFDHWSYEEIMNLMTIIPFSENWFNDFDENGLFRRVNKGYLGCSITLDRLGGGFIKAFLGCGFCNWNSEDKPMLKKAPCSGCPVANFSAEYFVPMKCDIHYRCLCADVEPFSKENDDPNDRTIERETGCRGEEYLLDTYLITFINPKGTITSLFLKTSYVLPTLTVGLLIYYMKVIKMQPFFYSTVPKYLEDIRKSYDS